MQNIKKMKLNEDEVVELQLYDIEKTVAFNILNRMENANTYNDFCIRKKAAWGSLNRLYADKYEKFERLRDSIIQKAEAAIGCKIQHYYISYDMRELEYTV